MCVLTMVQFNETAQSILIRCKPADGARIDLALKIPHSTELIADSASGSIALNGLVLSALLLTKTGDLTITTPWRLMRIWAISKERPREVLTPKLKIHHVPYGHARQGSGIRQFALGFPGSAWRSFQAAWSQGWERLMERFASRLKRRGAWNLWIYRFRKTRG
jgi:hypothetical protein